MCEFFLGEFRLQVSSRRKEQKKIHAHSRVGRKCMLTFAHKHSIGLLLSGVVRFNQNSRRKHKICYCPKIFPYLLVSTLVKDNISYYQSLKIVNNIFTFYTSCLFLLNISLTCFSLSTISLRKRSTTINQDLVTLGSKNMYPCTCFSLNAVKSFPPQSTSNLLYADISFPSDT